MIDYRTVLSYYSYWCDMVKLPCSAVTTRAAAFWTVWSFAIAKAMLVIITMGMSQKHRKT